VLSITRDTGVATALPVTAATEVRAMVEMFGFGQQPNIHLQSVDIGRVSFNPNVVTTRLQPSRSL
jgi:hypothetical protein